MFRSENVATPPTAKACLVPNRRPPLGLVPIATVTFPLKSVAVVPDAFRAVTLTAGKIGALAVVVLGWTVKTRRVAVPTAAALGPAMPISDDPSQPRMTVESASKKGA